MANDLAVRVTMVFFGQLKEVIGTPTIEATLLWEPQSAT